MSAATKAPILMDDQRPDRSRRKGMLQARSSHHGEDICGRDNTRSNDGRASTIADHDLKNTTSDPRYIYGRSRPLDAVDLRPYSNGNEMPKGRPDAQFYC